MKFPLLSSLFVSSLAAETEECQYALELLALQDGSGSFAEHIDRWATQAELLIERLGEEFGEYKIGLSSFTDKPIPRSGYGMYGGWGAYKQDYCYASHVPLSQSAELMVEGLEQLKAMIGSGFDIPEAQAEAMIFAALDDKIGWSDPSVSHSESGRPIARIMLLITDARSHEAGQAKNNIGMFNAPRWYPSGYGQPSSGGFGAHDFPKTYLVAVDEAGESAELYREMADLFAVADAHEAGDGVAMTVAESMRLQELITLFGPYPYPEVEYPQHPGDNSVPDCTKTEYPSLEQMILALKSKGILPIFLTSTQDAFGFYQWYQENLFTPLGVNSIVSMFDSENLFDNIIDSINRLVAKKCLETTTTTSTTTTTTTKPVVIPPPVTEAPPTQKPSTTTTTTPSTEAPKPTSVITSSEVATPTAAISDSTAPAETTTEAAEPSATTEEEEEEESTSEGVSVSSSEEPVQPPVAVPPPAAAGSNTGTIAGAAAGATAGLAAVGGLLYKTLGAGMFGGQTADLGGVEQMEVPESPIEREAMEEVTMDMFH